MLKSILGITVMLAFSGILFSQVFAQSYTEDQVNGVVHFPDDRIHIVQHVGYLWSEADDYRSNSDSIIFGDILNVSDETVYYIIMRANVYDDGKQLTQTGYGQKYTFRYNYDVTKGNPNELAISPYKMTLQPGEAAPFALWPNQVGWDCYELWVESYELEDESLDITDDRLRNELVIKNGKISADGIFSASVFNPTEQAIRHVYVAVVLYDDDNQIFGIFDEDLDFVSAGRSKSFSIHVYNLGHNINAPTETLGYDPPTKFEVLVWGYSGYNEGSGTNIESTDKGHPVKLLATSKYYPDQPRPKYMNLEELKESANPNTRPPGYKDFCPSKQVQEHFEIPNWIKTNAKRLQDSPKGEQIFLSGIQYLIEKGIMIAPKVYADENYVVPSMPNWSKEVAIWWVEGKITDDDFLFGIKYLIEREVIRI